MFFERTIHPRLSDCDHTDAAAGICQTAIYSGGQACAMIEWRA